MAVERGRGREEEWNERLDAYRGSSPSSPSRSRFHGGRLPDGWDAELLRFSPDDKPVATRKASNEVIQWIAARVPTLVSGSADLEPSTLT